MNTYFVCGNLCGDPDSTNLYVGEQGGKEAAILEYESQMRFICGLTEADVLDLFNEYGAVVFVNCVILAHGPMVEV